MFYLDVGQKQKTLRPPKPKPMIQPMDSSEKAVIFTQDYCSPSNRSKTQAAVIVHKDGSGQVQWPNGNLAVSVDAVVVDGQPQYRLFAGIMLSHSGD